MHLAGKQVTHGGIFLEQALVATPPKARWPASKLDILDNLEKWHWFFFSDMYPLKMETGFMCIYIYILHIIWLWFMIYYALLSCDCQQLGHDIYVSRYSQSCNLFLTDSRWLRRPGICSTSSSSDEVQTEMPWGLSTVDGNPAPVDMENLPLFTRFYNVLYIQTVVVWDFWTINSMGDMGSFVFCMFQANSRANGLARATKSHAGDIESDWALFAGRCCIHSSILSVTAMPRYVKT